MIVMALVVVVVDVTVVGVAPVCGRWYMHDQFGGCEWMLV